MATKTFMVASGSDGNFAALVDGVDQTAASRADGWTVAKLAALNMSEFDVGVKQASGTFSTAAKPASFQTGSAANAFKTPAALKGDFANTAWTFTFAVRAGTASAQAGRMRMRVFKSVNADGSGATELTGATQVGTTSSALSTTADVTTVVTWSPGALTLNNEYLFFVIAWEITTASGSNSGDVLIRTGQAAGGSRLVTPDLVLPTPKSGTDANGTTTEGQSVVASTLVNGTDASGATTEDTISVERLTVTDTGSAADTATASAQQYIVASDPETRTYATVITDFATYSAVPPAVPTYAQLPYRPPYITATENAIVSTPAVPVASSDSNGATTETASVTKVAHLVADANGATTETGTPKAVQTTADSGSGSDVASPRSVSADAGTGVETSRISLSTNDANGATTETATYAFSLQTTDANGATTESATAVPQITFVNSFDSGTSTETATFRYALNAADANGATTEAQSAVSSASSSDSNGATTETSSVGAVIVGSDSGAGSETAATSASLQTTDTNGATTEAVSFGTPLSVSDTSGATTEAATVVNKATTTDVGTSSETAALVATIAATDTNGATTETAAPRILSGDTNGWSESAQVVVKITDVEIGTSIELATTGLFRLGTDTNDIVTESASVGTAAIVTSDTNGSTTETTTRRDLYVIFDSGVSTETQAVVVSALSTDAGLGSDIGDIVYSMVVADGGTSLEYARARAGNIPMLPPIPGGRLRTGLSGKIASVTAGEIAKTHAGLLTRTVVVPSGRIARAGTGSIQNGGH